MRSHLTHVAERALHIYDRWRPYRIYLHALLIFAASRLVVKVGLNFGTLLPPAATPWRWDAGPAWYHRMLRWDTVWYAGIIRNGYGYSDDASVQSATVFYPLYPLVSSALKSLLGIDEYLALLLVANVASVIVVLLMTKFFVEEVGDEVALVSLAFFSFFPSSLFLSAGYTESLCLVFILLGLILSARKKFVLASVSAGLSLGTRSTGIVLIPVILWEMWSRQAQPLPRLLPRMALCGVLAASGLLLYMAYLGVRFGHPMAFATGQSTWQGGTFLDRLVSAATLSPFRHFDWPTSGWFLCFLVLTIWSFRHLRFPVSLYALATLMLPYLTLGITGSTNRFVLMCFPAFMCMGILCKGRPWLAAALIGIFGALLLFNTALFSQWYWVG
jgi:Mannosyltransferase (PIG-V)